MADQVLELRLAGRAVAAYQIDPELDPTLSPRPFLHPVRTLAGVVVTDALPEDHRWHLGAGLAVQDVSGTNLWGGRTYVRDAGYTWRDDHGRILHEALVARTEQRVVQRLRWSDPAGQTLLREERELLARPVADRADAWALEFGYALTAPADRDIVLGSPATNGRPGGSGYGGFFWRAAAGAGPPRVFTASAAGERTVNGSTERWVALASLGPDPYTLVFTGLGAGEHWFVRASMYPGVCAAMAYEKPVVIPAGERLTGRYTVLVADAVLSPRSAGRLATA